MQNTGNVIRVLMINRFKKELIKEWSKLQPFTKILVYVTIPAALLATFDFLDLGIWAKHGWFHQDDIEALVALWVGVPLFMTLWETLQSNYESRKQTELQLRPYLSVHWVSGPVPNERIGQGIKSTCLKLRNDGAGLMLKVNYIISIDGLEVNVRNHAVITPASSTWVAYGEGDPGEILGNPIFQNQTINDPQKGFNDQTIAEAIIVVEGTYEDLVGGKYPFKIISDKKSQSWFTDQIPQERIK